MFNVTPNAPATDFDDALNQFKEELSKSLESSLGVQLKSSRNTYQKLYPSTYDFMKAPDGWRVPGFLKFSGDDSKSTIEHISMFLAQLGKASAYDFVKVRNFLCLLPAQLLHGLLDYHHVLLVHGLN
jgi:hypothetical protein